MFSSEEGYELGRTNGPAHDGVGIIDSVYESGAWDTLSISGIAMTLVGYSPHEVDIEHDDGKKGPVQGGLFLMVRGADGYTMTMGGGA